jgi:hypothetical protein
MLLLCAYCGLGCGGSRLMSTADRDGGKSGGGIVLSGFSVSGGWLSLFHPVFYFLFLLFFLFKNILI